jgi:hypothetical protein
MIGNIEFIDEDTFESSCFIRNGSRPITLFKIFDDFIVIAYGKVIEVHLTKSFTCVAKFTADNKIIDALQIMHPFFADRQVVVFSVKNSYLLLFDPFGAQLLHQISDVILTGTTPTYIWLSKVNTIITTQRVNDTYHYVSIQLKKDRAMGYVTHDDRVYPKQTHYASVVFKGTSFTDIGNQSSVISSCIVSNTDIITFSQSSIRIPVLPVLNPRIFMNDVKAQRTMIIVAKRYIVSVCSNTAIILDIALLTQSSINLSYLFLSNSPINAIKAYPIGETTMFCVGCVGVSYAERMIYVVVDAATCKIVRTHAFTDQHEVEHFDVKSF